MIEYVLFGVIGVIIFVIYLLFMIIGNVVSMIVGGNMLVVNLYFSGKWVVVEGVCCFN